VRERVLAWGVHLYTATGLVVAAAMAVLIIRGGDEAFRGAMLLMILATVIDSTDGMLARRFDVKRWTPEFDGRRLDDITDFHTYTSLPLLFIWRAGLLPGNWNWVLLAPLIASAYGFSQTDAKTKDGFFLGFPSYWNAIAIYLYLLHPPATITIAGLLICAFLTFVPTRYLYPNYGGGPYSRSTSTFAVLWSLLLVFILAGICTQTYWIWLSLAFPIYYLGVSWWITLIRPAGAD
jgi:phosphatidylcholine synthase